MVQISSSKFKVSSFKLQRKGFTLFELLLIIFVIFFIVGIVTLILNPKEILKRERDVQRMKDLDNLYNAVLFLTKKGVDIQAKECNRLSPCISSWKIPSGERGHNLTKKGHKLTEVKNGWLPLDFSIIEKEFKINYLPVDPLNKDGYYYRYVAKGQDFVFDCKFESNYYNKKVKLQEKDKGSCKNSYERGTKNGLKLLEGICRK